MKVVEMGVICCSTFVGGQSTGVQREIRGRKNAKFGSVFGPDGRRNLQM